MDLDLADEQRLLVDAIAAFVGREIYPHEDAVDRLGEVPPELAAEIKGKALAAGFYAANMPEDVGGGGLDNLSLALL